MAKLNKDWLEVKVVSDRMNEVEYKKCYDGEKVEVTKVQVGEWFSSSTDAMDSFMIVNISDVLVGGENVTVLYLAHNNGSMFCMDMYDMAEQLRDGKIVRN